MEEAKRWTVTYTKHMKQKRKVYQDGYVLLLDKKKAILYDDCDKLVASKFLKEDENLRSGESLTFGTFLVDISDSENAELAQEEKSKQCSGPDKNCIPRRQKVSVINISPSQRIIREFKKNEKIKYALQEKSPSSTNSVAGDERVSSSKNRSYVTAYTLLKKGNPPHVAGSGKDVEQKLNYSGFNADKVGSTGIGAPNMSFRGGKDVEQKLNSSGVNADKVGSTESSAPNMSLRGVHQILSFLKKPTSPRSTFVTEQAPKKQCCPSPNLVMLDTDYCKERFEGIIRQDLDQLSRHGTRESEDTVAQYEGLTQTNSKTDKNTESRVNPFGMSRKIKIEKDCDDDISVQLKSSSAVVFSSMERPTPLRQGLDSVAATKTTCSSRPVISSTTEVMLPLIDLENPQPRELMSSKGISDSTGNRFPTSTQSGDAHQHCKAFSKANPTCSEVVVEMRESASHACGEAEHPVKMKSAKIWRSSTKMDDRPSFDLGF